VADAPAPDRAAAPAPRGRRLRRRLALSLLVLLGLLLLAELGLRAWAAWRGIDVAAVLGQSHPEGGLYAPHPFIGYVLRPERGSLENNAQGMRGPEVALAKPPGVVRILCLGGSTTYGAGVEPGESYPARLQRLLSAEPAPPAPAVPAPAVPPARRFEVLNCGVPGYTTAESLIALELQHLEFQPDALVISHGINDARLVQAKGFRPDYAHVRRHWREPELSALEWWAWRHSAAWALVARTLDFGPKSIRIEDLVFVDGYAALYEPPEAGVNRAGVAVYVRNIDHMVALARARGLDVLLCTIALRRYPNATKAPAQDYTPTVDAMNAELRAYAQREGVPLVDLAQQLDRRVELYDDQVHMNAQGTAVQAELVLAAARAAGQWGLR
jgi:lysophospholipase L1-like esterase